MGFGFGFILGLSGELKKKSPVPGLHPRIKQVHLRLRTTVLDLKGKKKQNKTKKPPQKTKQKQRKKPDQRISYEKQTSYFRICNKSAPKRS